MRGGKQNEEFITVDVSAAVVSLGQGDYAKIARAKGLLKGKRSPLLAHLNRIRQEWG